ncbi:hypothetical protein OG547_35365 (plasmid) [Streptomyces longwoodensis]|uniref:hypothetical protein n=1 Tax=Streptomyces longwoodensis TaxID=68231 RepID=UPI002ED04FD4|nr:hypothetical protein OG547_35365 [Streptomyces longwoodensis]
MSNNPQDRHAVALALMGAALAGFIAFAHPALIPALTVAFAAFMALAAFLML